MPDKLFNILPFVLMTTEGKYKLNFTRVIEAVIIAAIGGTMAGYIAMKELSVEVRGLKDQVVQVQSKIDKIDERLWQHQTATENGKK